MDDNKCKACHEGLKMLYTAMSRPRREDELAAAAKKAATTGNRSDLHEYLRLRRER